MNIQEFRKQFPQYNDMSDESLASSMYEKHYKDIPKEEFNAKFLGTEVVPTTEGPGFVERLAKTGPTAMLAEGIKNLARMVPGTATDVRQGTELLLSKIPGLAPMTGPRGQVKGKVDLGKLVPQPIKDYVERLKTQATTKLGEPTGPRGMARTPVDPRLFTGDPLSPSSLARTAAGFATFPIDLGTSIGESILKATGRQPEGERPPTLQEMGKGWIEPYRELFKGNSKPLMRKAVEDPEGLIMDAAIALGVVKGVARGGISAEHAVRARTQLRKAVNDAKIKDMEFQQGRLEEILVENGVPPEHIKEAIGLLDRVPAYQRKGPEGPVEPPPAPPIPPVVPPTPVVPTAGGPLTELGGRAVGPKPLSILDIARESMAARKPGFKQTAEEVLRRQGEPAPTTEPYPPELVPQPRTIVRRGTPEARQIEAPYQAVQPLPLERRPEVLIRENRRGKPSATRLEVQRRPPPPRTILDELGQPYPTELVPPRVTELGQRVTPQELVPPQKTPSPEVPNIRSTDEAIAFGKSATKPQLAEVGRRRSRALREAKDAMASGNLQLAMDASTQAQVYRETIEAAKGKLTETGYVGAEMLKESVPQLNPTGPTIPTTTVTEAPKAQVPEKKAKTKTTLTRADVELSQRLDRAAAMRREAAKRETVESVTPTIPEVPRPLHKTYGPKWEERPDADALRKEYNKAKSARSKALQKYKASVEESNKQFRKESVASKIKAKLTEEKGSITFTRKTDVERKFAKAAKRAVKHDQARTVKRVMETTNGMRPEAQAKMAEAAEIQDKDPKAARKKVVDSIISELYAPVPFSPDSQAAHAFFKTGNVKDYFENQASIGELKPKELKGKEGITTVLLPPVKEGGKWRVVTEVRGSGHFVHKSFADKFVTIDERGVFHLKEGVKDIGPWRKYFQDFTRLMQAIDGGEIGGKASEMIDWPTRDSLRARELYTVQKSARLHEIFHDNGISTYWILGKKNIRQIFEVLNGGKPIAKPNVYKASGEMRKFFDEMLEEQNASRANTGRAPIKRLEDYVPWVMRNIFMDILMGQKSTPEGIIKGAGAPDFIQPNAPFNPRALPRTAGYDRFLKDKDVFSLGIKYINTAAKDIINTDIISNMKVHAKFFKDIGLDHASEALLKVAAEKFAGKPTAAQKFFDSLPRPFSYVLAANRFAYRGMMKSIFPLNFVWNFMVQSNAAVMLPARVGYGNTVKALATWTDPVMRKAVQNTYVHMLKASSRNPQLHEMGALAERYRNLERETVSEKMSDQLNFMTRWVEKYCTDHAVAAGLEHGKQLGLKGRALLEYASDVGARTQGLNNFENLPSLLGSRDVKALAPLQTFYLEALNNVADIVLAEGSHFGRTKLQRTTSFAKLCATIYASNLITDAVIGRDTWGPMAFIPFGSFISMAMDLGDRYEAKPVPIGQMVNDFRKAARGVAYYDNWNDAYKFMAYWSHLPGGRSIWRHYQGIKAGEEGEVRDISGKTMFQVPPESALKSALVGPYGTKEGKEWIKKKDDRTIMETLLGGKEPSSGSSGGRHRRTRRSR